MTAPNMATMTASLERSLRSCSLNGSSPAGQPAGGFVRSATSDSVGNNPILSSSVVAASAADSSSSSSSSLVELNSHVSLPYQWEQCLDLKTGEIYYINWRNGSKMKEDPRKTTMAMAYESEYFYSEEEDDEEDDSEYDSEGSSSASSPSENYVNGGTEQVLVVAGCKSCMMYFMLPKRVEQCPKCNAFLLHFDGSQHKSP